MTILDTFYILFDSDASKLDKGIDSSEKKAGGLIEKLGLIDKEGGKAGAKLFELTTRAAGILGIGVSIAALAHGVQETAAAYEQLGKLAARFRSTADAVDEFRDAAGLLNISEETSVGALTALDTAIQDTYLGMGRAKKVFEEMKISIKDGHGKIKPTTEVMSELADKMSKMEKGTQIRVMERLGLDPVLLKLFNSDLIGLQKRMADVDKASGFNLEMAVKRSQEYTKAQKGLSLEVNTLKMYLEKLVESFKISSMPFFTNGLITATKYVRMFVDYLMNHSKFVEGFVIAIAGAIMYFLVPAAITGAIAIWAMIAPFALIGLAVIATATAFALLYDDIMNFIEGGDSMIGKIVARWPVIGEIIKAIGAEFVFLWDTGKALWNFLIGMFDDPAAAFEQFKSDMTAGIDRLVEHFPGLKDAVGMVTDVFTTAGDAITGVWDAIIASIQAAIAVVMDAINTVTSAYNNAKSFLGLGGNSSGNVAAGQGMLSAASSSGLGAQTSNSINNTQRGGRSTSVSVGKVEVHTQATDAAGISKAIGGSMQSQMRQAANNFDDGILV